MAEKKIKIVAIGGCGKAGSEFVKAALADPEVKLIGILEAETHPAVGISTLEGVLISSDPAIMSKADVAVEFSSKLAVAEHAGFFSGLSEPRPSWLICTTGIEEDPTAMAALEGLREKMFVMLAPNVTLGMIQVFVHAPLMLKSLAKAGWKAVGYEIHHDRKDPTKASGTAVALDMRAQRIAGTGIPFTWGRILDVIGDHEVTMVSPAGEKVILKHTVPNRGAFGTGAVAIAKQIVGLPPNLIHVADWGVQQLGLATV